MKHLSRTLVSLVVLPLAGCALLQPIPAAAPELALEPPKPAMVLPALGEGQAAAALDQSSAADKAEAAAVTPAASAGALGLGLTDLPEVQIFAN